MSMNVNGNQNKKKLSKKHLNSDDYMCIRGGYMIPRTRFSVLKDFKLRKNCAESFMFDIRDI